MEMVLMKEWGEEVYRFMASKAGAFFISSFYLLEGIRPTSPGYRELFLMSSPTEVKTMYISSMVWPKKGLAISMKFDINDTSMTDPLFVVKYSLIRRPLREEYAVLARYSPKIYREKYKGLFRKEERTLYLETNQYRNIIVDRRILEANMTKDGRWMGEDIYELAEGGVELASLKLVPLL